MKSTPIKVVISVIILCNVVGFGILFITKITILQNVTFSANLSSLGSSLVTYATAMMALLIAMVVVLFGIDNDRLRAFQKAGYLHATYLLYMVTFFELGLTMAFSLLCMSNIQSIKVASYSLTFALITFLLICLLGFQLMRLKKS
ncbi:TPA: hypothetical protein QHM50_001453 [Morganella morganii subsp. morganii]|nr:hypothetical protein [Morganella morganii subsp. morganii]